MVVTADALEAPVTQSELARSLVGDISVLVSPPDVCLKINDMVRDDAASADEFAEVILRDPSLTARLLKIVNSPYTGLRTRVDTIARAVTIVGMNDLVSLAFAVSAVEKFSKIESRVTNMNTFWRHGVYTGLASRRLARTLSVLHPERLFVAGLLHDIGTLAINLRLPDVAAATIAEARGDESILARLEFEALGFDHTELGGLMLESWNLPAATCAAVRQHHTPALAGPASLEAGIVHLADILGNASGVGAFSTAQPENLNLPDGILASLGLGDDFEVDAFLTEVDREFVETIYLLVA